LFPNRNTAATLIPDDEALASEYETTRDSLKSIQNLILELPTAKDDDAVVGRWRDWRGPPREYHLG
jgi:hypothetical protein